MTNKETTNKSSVCPQCGTHFRQVLDMQIRIEQLEDAQKNLLEKIKQLENLKVYEGLDAEFLQVPD